MGNSGGMVSWSRTTELGRSVIQVSGDFTTEELTELFRNIVQETRDGEVDQPCKIVHNAAPVHETNGRVVTPKTKNGK